MSEPRQIATAILNQLGGNRFRAMTGARDFAFGEKGSLGFRIPASRGINHVLISLNAKDLYDVRFCFVRSGKVFEKAKHFDIWCDGLQELFTRETGLETRL